MTANTFKVLHIDEMTRLSEVGGVEKFYRHQIKTRGGVVLTIDIGERDLTDEKVAVIAGAKAAMVDKILAL